MWGKYTTQTNFFVFVFTITIRETDIRIAVPMLTLDSLDDDVPNGTINFTGERARGLIN